MASASVLVLGSVPAMAKTDETKTESGEEAEASEEKDTDAAKADTLEDGVYTAEFGTDSSMFHVNEANDKKGELTVKDGKMTIHVSLVSKKIVNLFAGTAEDAQKDGAEIIEPTTDTVNLCRRTDPISYYFPLIVYDTVVNQRSEDVHQQDGRM